MQTTGPLRDFKTTIAGDELIEEGKDLISYVRLPYAIAVRVQRQAKRLSCSRNVFARMAIIKLVEEEESKERANSERTG